MEVGAPDTASDVFVSPQPALKQNTCEAVKPPIPWPTRARGVMSTDGRGGGEMGADCLTWGEALSNGPLHTQEGPHIHSISLAVKECAELTEQLPDLEPIIKGTDMTKVRLGTNVGFGPNHLVEPDENYSVSRSPVYQERLHINHQAKCTVQCSALTCMNISSCWGACALAEGDTIFEKKNFLQHHVYHCQLWNTCRFI